MISVRKIEMTKRKAESMRALDIRKLQREGRLKPGRRSWMSWTRGGDVVASINLTANEGAVTLDYQSRSALGEWESLEYRVCIEWTDCNYGGRRPWFLCPAHGCGRRVAILFGGRLYACRHCHRLAYESQQEDFGDRAMRAADNIRIRLGWRAGIANPLGTRPKGMHWITYYRLTMKYFRLASQSLAATSEKLGIVTDKLDGLANSLQRRSAK